MKKLIFFINDLKATFWFIPVLIIIVAIFLAIGLVAIDQVVNLSQDGMGRFFFVNSTDSARSILSTISGAMIGVAGTVFSVTLVVLTLASSQFGPRLIRNFMYVRLNQVVLGSYVATYLYCLFVLSAIKQTEISIFIPSLSILFAVIIAFVNIILLIVFIHRTAVSIQADKVISDIATVITGQIEILYPKEIGNELDDEIELTIDEEKQKYKHVINVKSPKSGYLQYIDSSSLLENVCSLDGLLKLDYRPGDHLVKDVEIGKFYTHAKVTKEQLEGINNQFIIRNTKNAQQDLEYSINQMVEIAVRALSSGINDPYTAIACIDNLTTIMCELAQVSFSSRFRTDEEDKLRMILDVVNFEGAMDVAFNQIRQFSVGMPAVIIRLMEALIIIDRFTNSGFAKKAVRKHARMVLNVGKESIKEQNDLNDFLDLSSKIVSS